MCSLVSSQFSRSPLFAIWALPSERAERTINQQSSSGGVKFVRAGRMRHANKMLLMINAGREEGGDEIYCFYLLYYKWHTLHMRWLYIFILTNRFFFFKIINLEWNVWIYRRWKNNLDNFFKNSIEYILQIKSALLNNIPCLPATKYI